MTTQFMLLQTLKICWYSLHSVFGYTDFLLKIIKECNLAVSGYTLNISRQPVNYFSWLMFSNKSSNQLILFVTQKLQQVYYNQNVENKSGLLNQVLFIQKLSYTRLNYYLTRHQNSSGNQMLHTLWSSRFARLTVSVLKCLT